MTEFEKVLQQCLYDLDQGAANVEECLRRYPTYAPELEPILLTTAYLGRAREVSVSDPFRARVRTKLIQQMQAHPRKRAHPGFLFMHGSRGATALLRLATGIAVIVLVLLAAGTAYAQSTLPGEMFYAWKLRSENAWRAVSPDPVGTDLAIAERRMEELIAVQSDQQLYAQTLRAYLEVTDRLKSEVSPQMQSRISAILNAQTEELKQSGIVLPQLEEEIPPLEPPTYVPPTTPAATPLPIRETPQVEPTRLPQIVPTVQVSLEPTIDIPPVELPPVQDPSEIIPTVEVPPLEDLSDIIPTVEVPPLEDLPDIVPTVDVPPLLP